MSIEPQIDGNPPDGVMVLPLRPHTDARGTLTEVHRDEWTPGAHAVQFNVVTSAAGVLRGVHVHVKHVDYLVVTSGRMLLGLHDLRDWSPTYRTSCMITLDGRQPKSVVTPCGVAHGFYFIEPSVHVYGVSHYWDTKDEIACRWDCPELGLRWPATTPLLSERDAAAGGYRQFTDTFRQAWANMQSGNAMSS
jgi:dTDP-4-dehydrorhamnose 3,5-epimerase